MRLEPYEQVDGRAFSLTRADVVASLGPPHRESQNGVGLYELDYGTVVYLIDDRFSRPAVRALLPEWWPRSTRQPSRTT